MCSKLTCHDVGNSVKTSTQCTALFSSMYVILPHTETSQSITAIKKVNAVSLYLSYREQY